MLKSVSISNFRSFSQSGRIDFSEKWTVIVGKNNSGKSSLLQALRLFSINPEPYRGVRQPRDRPLNPQSSVEFALSVPGSILHHYLMQINGMMSIGVPNGAPADGARSHVEAILSADGGVIVRGSNTTGQPPFISGVSDTNDRKIYPDNRYDIYRVSSTDGRIDFYTHGDAPRIDFLSVISNIYGQISYFFDAERLHISTSAIDNVTHLSSNASNLAQVLNKMHENRSRYSNYVNLVSEVFPEITDVVPVVVGQNMVEIRIGTAPPDDEREDLLVSLAHSGTGVSQVLAILYVILTSTTPKTIAIDEPNSFLHPGAAKQLIRILKRYPQHQFIVSTHSPEIISEISPETLLVVKWTPEGSNVSQIKSGISGLREALREIGAQFSDLFGLDGVIFVEGETEVDCFTEILKVKALELSRGVAFVKIGDPDKVTGKNATTYLNDYERIFSTTGVIPPVLAFCRDRESLSDTEVADFERKSGQRLRLLPRRCYENYLLNADALSDLLNRKGVDVTPQIVGEWISTHGKNKVFWRDADDIPDVCSDAWLRQIDGALFLKKMIGNLTEQKWEYRKITDGIYLTRWLLANAPQHISGLIDFVVDLARLRAPAL